jgi:hypothetical protein
MAGKRAARRTVIGLAIASALLTGCGGVSPSAGVAEPAEESRADVASKSDQGIRRDKDLVKQYFPELGNFHEVVWKGEILGGDPRSLMPGPSDFEVSGVVRLADADVAKLRQDYTWQVEPGAPVVLSDIHPRVPKSVQWQTSENFTAAITEGRYAATFYADFDQKIVVFDARNPRKKTS